MTNKEFSTTLNEVYRKYQCRFMSGKATKIKGGIIAQIKIAYLDNGEVPQKIKFNHSIKRKYIANAVAELGLKVTRYTREYGKTIVHLEPISDSK